MPVESGNFKIVIDRSLRLNQLVELPRTDPITRTPHIGNLNPVELGLMSLGIPLRLVDKNCSTVDNLFQPEAQILNQELVLLSHQQGVVAPYLQDGNDRSIAKHHFEVTRLAVPGGTASTYSQDYLAAQEKIYPVLQGLAELAPELFDRITHGDGTFSRQCGHDDRHVHYGDPARPIKIERDSLVERCLAYFKQVSHVIASGLPATESGLVLLKADADFILQAVMDTAVTSGHGRRRFYHCCGIPMTRYAADPRLDKPGKINHLYRLLQKRVGRLPDVEMVLLPISHFRFVYMQKKTLGLHTRILGLEQELERIKREKGLRIRSAPSTPERDLVIEQYRPALQQLHQQLKACVDELTDGRYPAFYISGSSQRFTQHDLAASDEPMRIPDDVMGLSLKNLSERLKKLLRHNPQRIRALFG